MPRLTFEKLPSNYCQNIVVLALHVLIFTNCMQRRDSNNKQTWMKSRSMARSQCWTYQLFAPRLSFCYLHSGSCCTNTVYSILDIDQFSTSAVKLFPITSCASQRSKGSRNSVINWSNLNSKLKSIQEHNHTRKSHYIYSAKTAFTGQHIITFDTKHKSSFNGILVPTPVLY